MEWKDLLIQNFDVSLIAMERTLQGLTQEDLDWQPKPDCNSIGWITWHVSRILDYASSFFIEEEQLWIKDGWCGGRPTRKIEAVILRSRWLRLKARMRIR